MDPWGQLLARGHEQHGPVTRRQALELGIGERAFDGRIGREEWARPHATVFVPPNVELGPLGRISAALLAAGPQAAASGASGLFVHGVVDQLRVPIRLVVPATTAASRRARVDGVKIIRSRTLDPDDITSRRRLTVTTPARCFVDLAIPPAPTLADARALLIDALQRRVLRLADLERQLARSRGVPGIPLLHRAVADLGTQGADSSFVFVVGRRLASEGIRMDAQPAEVATRGRVLRPDLTRARDRVAIECDSLRWHGSQRSIHKDALKDRAYADARWRVLRIGWYEFDNAWAGFVGDLRRALREADPPA